MEGNGDEPRVHDGEAGALSLFLGLLHLVDVLKYVGFVGIPHVPCGHGRMEGDDVIGLSAAAAGS